VNLASPLRGEDSTLTPRERAKPVARALHPSANSIFLHNASSMDPNAFGKVDASELQKPRSTWAVV
jgi:hypothetical protein